MRVLSEERRRARFKELRFLRDDQIVILVVAIERELLSQNLESAAARSTYIAHALKRRVSAFKLFGSWEKLSAWWRSTMFSVG